MPSLKALTSLPSSQMFEKALPMAGVGMLGFAIDGDVRWFIHKGNPLAVSKHLQSRVQEGSA